MKWVAYVLFMVTFLVGLLPAQNEIVRDHLRVRLEQRFEQASLTAAREYIFAKTTLPRFYQQRDFQPAWCHAGRPTGALVSFVDALDRLDREGLRPEDYHLAALKHLLEQVPAKGALPANLAADLDLLATDAFLMAAAHLLSGRLDPQVLDAEWHADRREMDLAEYLQKSLATPRLDIALQDLTPNYEGYRALRRQLALLRTFPEDEAGAPLVFSSGLKPGQSHADVVLVRDAVARLTGMVPAPQSEPTGYDPALVKAVKALQRSYGLDDDGVIGSRTQAMLSQTRSALIQRIEINMERWRWLPRDLGDRHILVNIADFSAEVWEQGRVVDRYQVIVGRDQRRTPVFSRKMTYLVLAPYWHVPPSLAVQDKLPLLRKDAAKLLEQGYEVFLGWGSEEQKIDVGKIDWRAVSAKNFPYRLRQKPGPLNALGSVKFMFPNPFNIYIHDTPSRELFAKSGRAFSSGCIRIERPLDLAAYLLRDQPRWTPATLAAAVAANQETTVMLSTPVMVHLLYWTVWADETGALQRRFDIYGRDQRVAEAWQETAPRPPANP